MKLFIACVAVLVPLVGSAQNFGNIDPAFGLKDIQENTQGNSATDSNG